MRCSRPHMTRISSIKVPFPRHLLLHPQSDPTAPAQPSPAIRRTCSSTAMPLGADRREAPGHCKSFAHGIMIQASLSSLNMHCTWKRPSAGLLQCHCPRQLVALECVRWASSVPIHSNNIPIGSCPPEGSNGFADAEAGLVHLHFIRRGRSSAYGISLPPCEGSK